ncbi:T9SS type A sorting domain-containing protein [bacterium]|nr:T9SS type A sorting domain-containing protein [bacterium]
MWRNLSILHRYVVFLFGFASIAAASAFAGEPGEALIEHVCNGGAVRCGTPSVVQSPLLGVEQRPVLPLVKRSPSGRFDVHYARSGDDATVETAVDSALSILDRMWELQIDQMGYRPPPPDQDGVIDVYMKNLRLFYGMTVPEQPGGRGVASYMVIENDFQEPVFLTKGLDALRVTLAHEFFHVIQFGYRYAPLQIGRYEWSSVWMEDVAFDDINDYHYYLSTYFQDPQEPLLRENGSREYATALFLFMLDQLHGPDLVRQAWERFESRPGNLLEYFLLEAVENGDNLENIASTWFAWSLFTGLRSVPGFGWEEAAWYPMIELPTLSPGGQYSAEAGYWGMVAARTEPFAGEIEVSLYDSTEALPAAAVEDGGEVQFGPLRQGREWYGANAFIGAVSFQRVGAKTMVFNLDEFSVLPSDFIISSVWPNPFNERVQWEVTVVEGGKLRFFLYDVLGREVFFHRYVVPAGRHTFFWDGRLQDGRPGPSGVYILRVMSPDSQAAHRLVKLR